MKQNEAIAHEIRALQTGIQACHASIYRYAALFIPDLHFMTHKIDPLYNCEDSPIGLCVFSIEMETGEVGNCVYCEQPRERE